MEALHFLYARYAPDVLSHVRDLVPGDREAEDITQNVFVGLIARMEKYEAGEGRPFIAWLLGVAHDAALEHSGTARPCGGSVRA